MKKQRFKIGGIIKIKLSDGSFVLGKILKDYYLAIYNKWLTDSVVNAKKSIEESDILLYAFVFKDTITSGFFEIIDFTSVVDDEISAISARFQMETAHPELCTILFSDGTERKALPSECVGLDFAFIWQVEGLTQLIEDRLNGKTNIYEDWKRKELEEGIAIEKERGMKVPWEGWAYN